MVICCKFKKNLFNLTLYISFHDLTKVYSCRSGADNPRGHSLMSTETSCRFSHLLQVSKNLSEVWFYTIFLMILYMYMPWGWQPLGDGIFMSTGTSCHFGHVLQVSKKSFWSLILYNCFHDFIHVYSPGAGANSPQGAVSPHGIKFWCQQKCLSLH